MRSGSTRQFILSSLTSVPGIAGAETGRTTRRICKSLSQDWPAFRLCVVRGIRLHVDGIPATPMPDSADFEY